MARVAYALVKRAQPYRGYHEHAPAHRIDPSHAGRRGACDPVDNAWTFRWEY
jgi:hypothetical protein